MGEPLIQKRAKGSRTVAVIVGAVGLPVLLGWLLVGMDMRSDLSGLKPAPSMPVHSVPAIGWPDLDPRDGFPAQTRWPSRTRVKMLGYMMEGYHRSPDGTPVSMFVLMADAGHFLHPPHRIPEETVEVWLTNPEPFKYRSLVWASGVLERTSGTALYALRDADVEPAREKEITRWFTP